MNYYRLCDIKTPPYAYVTNKEEAIQHCQACQIPFPELAATLEVDILTLGGGDMAEALRGKPLMADLWLVGDAEFAASLESALPGMFTKSPVNIASWLTRRHTYPAPESPAGQSAAAGPRYYHFRPVHQTTLDAAILESFPPISCNACRRAIPDIPFDLQPLPGPAGKSWPVFAVRDFQLEGYGYLFHESVAPVIERLFPEMILERLLPQPLPI